METRVAMETSLPLSKVLRWVGGILVAAVVATFTITKYANDNRVATLQDQLKAQRGEILQLKESPASPALLGQVPQATLEASSNSAEVKSLVAKINNLESERNELLNNLLKHAKNALDPKSELYPLVNQLDSGSEQKRARALEGLFSLRDPRSVPYLIAYYNKHPQEATTGDNTEIWRWFNLLFDLDRPAGLSFMLNVFAGGSQLNADFAYRDLRGMAGDTKDVSAIRGRLREIALRSPDALTRTRAKLLLQDYQEWNKPGFKQPDNRSIMEILLDIERDVKKLEKGRRRVSK